MLPVSYEVCGGSITIRSGSSTRVLVPLADIVSWSVIAPDSRAVSVQMCNDDRKIVVGGRQGALRELLQRVAAEKRLPA